MNLKKWSLRELLSSWISTGLDNIGRVLNQVQGEVQDWKGVCSQAWKEVVILGIGLRTWKEKGSRITLKGHRGIKECGLKGL